MDKSHIMNPAKTTPQDLVRNWTLRDSLPFEIGSVLRINHTNDLVRLIAYREPIPGQTWGLVEFADRADQDGNRFMLEISAFTLATPSPREKEVSPEVEDLADFMADVFDDREQYFGVIEKALAGYQAPEPEQKKMVDDLIEALQLAECY